MSYLFIEFKQSTDFFECPPRISRILDGNDSVPLIHVVLKRDNKVQKIK